MTYTKVHELLAVDVLWVVGAHSTTSTSTPKSSGLKLSNLRRENSMSTMEEKAMEFLKKRYVAETTTLSITRPMAQFAVEYATSECVRLLEEVVSKMVWDGSRCPASEHDPRWCSYCEARGDQADFDSQIISSCLAELKKEGSKG